MSEVFFEKMLAVYAAGLRFVLRHKFATLMFSLAILVATGWLFVKIPKGFLPSEDQGQIFIQLEGAQGTSFEELVRHQQEAMAIVSREPTVAAYFSAIRGVNSGIISLRLVPRHDRKLSADEIIGVLRPKLSAIPGVRASLQNPPPIRLGGRSSQSLYQYTMQAPDTNVLYESSNRMLEKMRALPGFVDVNTDLLIRNPQVSVDIDRDRAASYGLTAQQIEDALASAYAARQVSTIYAPTNSYQVVMELAPEFRGDPNSLSMLYIRAASGELVPLSAFAKITASVGPLTVNHSGQTPSVTISFNLKPGVPLGDAVKQINDAARTALPASVTTSFQGTAQAVQSSMQGLGLLLIMAIAVIYMVLGVLYESFIHPLTILSALPFAGFGALLTLLVFGTDLSIYAFVGVIMLVGLVKKNGIMMVDFAIETQKAGITAERAIYDACLVRFRPIMMTTMAALMGTLPIALGLGAGAESRRPLGLAVVGGLLFSQMLTLYVTPVFYVYMDRLRKKEAETTEVHEEVSEEIAGITTS
jgi:HAE1 family hydrophobic/amphiphilic exporter-1